MPPPETLNLETNDGVALRCTYYPGGFVLNPKTKDVTRISGKEVVPIIMLHGWEGQRREFDFTAVLLQRLGHAVVVPDLRGHGESTSARIGPRTVKLERDRMGRVDLENMVLLDVEAVKRFLIDKNNASELNIELLCVVGAELGATVALNWAVLDWNQPQLPAFKRGRDVKALVLLSPPASFKGLNANAALKHPIIQSALSVMIVVGKDDREGYREAKSIHTRLEKARERLPTDPKERQKRQDLFFIEPATSLSGTKLLTPRGLSVNQDLVTFLQLRLVSKKGGISLGRDVKSPLASQ